MSDDPQDSEPSRPSSAVVLAAIEGGPLLEEETAAPPRRKRGRPKRKTRPDPDTHREISEKDDPETKAPAVSTKKPKRKRTVGPSSEDVKKDEKTENTGGKPPRSKARKRKGKGKSRGSIKDRTCPDCKRVFTSILGKNYHVTQRVCQTKTKPSKKNETTLLHPTLSPGAMFETDYGLVKVIRDDRALSTLEMSQKEFKQSLSVHRRSETERDKIVRRLEIDRTAGHLQKRIKLNELYRDGKINQQSVFEVAFGKKHPRLFTVNEVERPYVPPPEKLHPSLHPDSHPHRIVECQAIADERTYYDADGNVLLHSRGSFKPRTETLYLNRHLLNDAYNPVGSVYLCEDCGQAYSTGPGLRYHIRSGACERKRKFGEEAMNDFLQQVAERVENEAGGSVEASLVAYRKGKRDAKTRNRKQELPVYPQIWSALGFKLVSNKPVSRLKVSAFRRKNYQESTASSDEEDNDSVVVGNASQGTRRKKTPKGSKPMSLTDRDGDPRLILAELEKVCAEEQKKLLGPMYPSVFSSLQFRRALHHRRRSRPVKKKKREENEKRANKVKKRQKVEEIINPEDSHSTSSDLRIYDVSIMINEVKLGRYPSMKTNDEDVVHEMACSICHESNKDDEPSLLCAFCTLTNHYSCLSTRCRVRYPEVGEDFMCYKCICYVNNMRGRAERRNQERSGMNTRNKNRIQSTAIPLDRLASECIRGYEAECVASQATEMNEILDLMDETNHRLRMQLATRVWNNHQRESLRKFEASMFQY